MSGSSGNKKDERDEDSFKAGGKLVESALRYTLAGRGLKGGIEAVPSLLKLIVLLAKIAEGSAAGEIETNAKLVLAQKRVSKQVTKAVQQYAAEIKEAKLKPIKPLKPVRITEKNAAHPFAVLEKTAFNYVKLVRKAHRVNASKE